MEKTEVSFTIVYNPSLIVEVGELMSRMDLGIGKVIALVEEELSWTTTTKVDEKYLSIIKQKITKAYKDNGHEVICLNAIYK